jgi:endonuclease/exonuclease/phosphatase family metal-dependent hydrolase
VAIGVLAAVGLAVTTPATGGASIAATDDGSRPLSVMTFNIEQGTTLGQLDLEQQARIIEGARPDVVVMEEVARGWSLSGMTDEVEWFSRRLGMDAAWSPAADNQFGNLVLSRLPIVGTELLPLGKGEDTQARSAVLVTIDLGDGNEALIIGAHLTNGDDRNATRAASYDRILSAWAGRPRTVLLGDFNTYPRQVPPGWPELGIPLDAGFRTTQDTERCTMPTSNQNCPDWIFTSPDLDLAPVTIVVDRPDHRPIAATVVIPE